jgi:hypothetical protein
VRYVPATRSPGLFLSYRRNDAGAHARLLKVQFHAHLPDLEVFMDVDSIELGTDFQEAIEEGVNSCCALIALIGPKWLEICDEAGRRRLEDPGDYVRFEIRTALERGTRVIPVLVDGARALSPAQLPDDIRKLARLNAHKMSYDRYEYDASRLIDVIRQIRAAGSTPVG